MNSSLPPISETISTHTYAMEQLEIETLLELWVDLIRMKNAGALSGFYAKDVVGFDLMGPLQNEGVKEMQNRTQNWFDSFKGEIIVDITELKIFADKDVAFAHSLNRYTGVKNDGKKEDMWQRVTMGFQKFDETWQIVHMHSSLPFDMKTGKVLIDATPFV